MNRPESRPRQANGGSVSSGLWLLLALAAGVHIWLVVSVAAQPFNVPRAGPSERAVVWPLYNDSVHRLGPAADFLAVYQAGLCLRNGRDPYANPARWPGVPYAYPFRYLPVVAYALGAPLSYLPARVAFELWVFLLELLLAVFLAVLWRRTEDPRLRLFAAAALLLSTPYFLELHMGQFTFATLALTASALLLLERPHPDHPGHAASRSGGAFRLLGRSGGGIAAAACFSAAVLLKLFPLVMAPALLRRGRAGRLTLAAAVAAVLLLNGPFFLTHPETWRHYLGRNFSPAAVWDGLNPGNFGLVYMLHLAWKGLGGIWSQIGWVRFVQVWRLAVLGGAAALVIFSRRDGLIPGAVLLLLAHFATFHHVWEHHYSGIVPLGLLLIWSLTQRHAVETADRGRSTRETRPTRTILWIGLAVLFWVMPTPFPILDRVYSASGADPDTTWPFWARVLTPAFKVLPLLFVLAWLVRDSIREGWALPWIRGETGRRSKPRRAPAPLVMAVAAASLVWPCRGDAREIFVDLFTGKSLPARSDIEIEQQPQDNRFTVHGAGFEDESFTPPLFYSIRLGAWLDRPAWLGLGMELIHAKRYLRDAQIRKISGRIHGLPAGGERPLAEVVQQFSVSHGENAVTMQALARGSLPFGRGFGGAPRDSAGPDIAPAAGRLQWTAGCGVGALVTHAENRIDGLQNRERYEIAGICGQLLAGVRLRVHPRAGLAAEYKITSGRAEVGIAGGSARYRALAQHLCGGITLRLR